VVNKKFSANNMGTNDYELVGYGIGYNEGSAMDLKEDISDKTIGYMAAYVIKFQNKHSAGDVIGMNIAINDCYTNVPQATAENPNPQPQAERAGILALSDPEYKSYEDPSCFGRVKLLKKPS
jgi:hypothetical protein